MLIENKNGFILSEALVALGIVSITIILVQSSIQSGSQTEHRLARQTEISRTMLDGSRRLKEFHAQTISLSDEELKFTSEELILKGTDHKVLRVINIEE
ncbi:hypothetical protein NVV78_09890 [Pediococcus ethanolidurans]|uniref:hypothetical protein n=1 Tax=Pediococcus ethanolidurans TaxID=319653 RepID=UPI001C1EA2FD|nr:hypothetical protein [Pediococcus ethanolidurans]MBU7555616.1 hypothetical protein [Pediococcus ethanolidurans]MBU7564337.1 hypothetical protein [Pediococcus ethanolidurans]MCT4398675.1 hypothetical protein [Pediococcus ethanolidurans]MCV3316239.1 hypothetical protein [Pediococcus ethanolidurans]MCV3322287.1 hypothetical protein [Pediococcus ethanolidurans]